MEEKPWAAHLSQWATEESKAQRWMFYEKGKGLPSRSTWGMLCFENKSKEIVVSVQSVWPGD